LAADSLASEDNERHEALKITMMILTDEQCDKLDPIILNHCIIDGLKQILEWTGSLRGALEIYNERYALLRELRPDEFTCTDEEYWDGFYDG